MSNVKMRIKSGFTFPASQFGVGYDYPKIEIIKAIRGCFKLTLRSARDLTERLVEDREGADVTSRNEDRVENTYYDREMITRMPEYTFLKQYFEFGFELTPDEVSMIEYVGDIKSLLSRALKMKRYDAARLIIALLEDIG